jgi:hypothetical protein
MRKDTERNNHTEKDMLSAKEVWLRISYLDPDKRDESNGSVVIALLAIVSIVSAVLILLHIRGL